MRASCDDQTDVSFSYIQSRLGCDSARTLRLGSPFNYAEQATLYVETDLPDPNDTVRFLPAACERVVANGGPLLVGVGQRDRRRSGSALGRALRRVAGGGIARLGARRFCRVAAGLGVDARRVPRIGGRGRVGRAVGDATRARRVRRVVPDGLML